ncbi:MAG: VCBS repeat-containing protein [Bacteroidetes bacterium]|nr:VCBS repeat-containing protein [Bacteroidota bacterium]
MIKRSTISAYAAFIALSLATFFSSCRNNKTAPLFVSLPSAETHISFANNLEKKKLFNILYYLYYYNGSGVATGDVNNDGLPDIYFAANSKGHNKLYLNKGGFTFEDITDKAKVAGTSDWCTGVAMADVNNDGNLDIYVSTVSSKYGLTGHNELYINNGPTASGEVSFTESSAAWGLNTSCFTTQSAFFDYDRDGDLDCYILNQSHHPHANIVDTVNRSKYDTLSGDRLYRNDGPPVVLPSGERKGGFTEVSKQAGIYQSNLGYGLGLAIADINNDGWDDIYIGNDFHENDYYYINNGNGTFSEKGASHFRHYSRFSMGNDVADYNNDGQPDIITVDMLPPEEKILKTYGSDENPDIYKVKLELRGYQYQYSKNCLQTNNGNGTSFSETALQSGVSATDWSWNPLFADFDNDGNKDLFISSGIERRPVDLDFIRFADSKKSQGMDETDKYDDEIIAAMPEGSSHPFLFKGDGKQSFSDMSTTWGTAKLKGCSNGAAYADLDNDGNLDLVINCLNAPAIILKNQAPKKNYISLSFKSDSINTGGIGCKAWLFAGGKMQYQQLMPVRGFMSSSSTQLHFGLDTLTHIDSLLIVWPGQQYQLIKNPAINKSLLIKRTDAQADFVYAQFFPPKEELMQDVSAQVTCNWKHTENDFLDYNVQYLIPHQLSTRGPKIAVADVNKDGLEDFYVCGAKLQPGGLMIQQANGSFQASDTVQFNKYAVAEEVDAVFFDANGDSWPDLFVITGGNELPANENALLDRLYLNDGKGHFVREEKAMSVVYENKSCVAVADVDNDGDQDIFLGNLASPVKYGYPTTSYLFLNDGTAHFTKAGDNIMPLFQLGMVTAASFLDIDNDGWKDLAVTGEWMPMKIFKNNKGKFTVTDLPQSSGLWQSLYTTDVNGDGFTDILAGNWGWNNKFYAGKNGPLKLYVKDFDNNGSIEQIMAYTIDGKQYPFLAKDELERSLPILKKAYLKYSDVAGQTVQYMFYDLFKDYKELSAEVLSSSCFINDGKGGFKRIDLPPNLQYAPVFSFAPVNYRNSNNFMAAGNFYGVIPYEGRYDALQPSFFSFNKTSTQFQYDAQLAGLTGQVRDAKWINRPGGGKLLILARNNQPLLFLKPGNEVK